jgi:hypothetical protein
MNYCQPYGKQEGCVRGFACMVRSYILTLRLKQANVEEWSLFLPTIDSEGKLRQFAVAVSYIEDGDSVSFILESLATMTPGWTDSPTIETDSKLSENMHNFNGSAFRTCSSMHVSLACFGCSTSVRKMEYVCPVEKTP